MRIETPIVSAASIETSAFSSGTGRPATRAPSSSSATATSARISTRDREQRAQPEHGDHDEVAARDGQDRAEQVREQIRVQRACRRDEHDAAGDARVEDDRERLVAGGAPARAQPLDPRGADQRGDERRPHRRDAEQVAGRDAGERDVTDAVADQAHLTLHEEEADRRREHADDRARGEREPHELEIKHGRATGRATGREAATGGPSKTIRSRTSTSRCTKRSTAPNSCET